MVMFRWQLEDGKRDTISNPMNLFPHKLFVLSAIAHLTKVRLLIGAITETAEVVFLYFLLFKLSISDTSTRFHINGEILYGFTAFSGCPVKPDQQW